VAELQELFKDEVSSSAVGIHILRFFFEILLSFDDLSTD